MSDTAPRERRGHARHQATVRRLLARLEAGDGAAFDELFPLVYRQLHDLARLQRRRWNRNATLNTTGLLHEAYVKLVDDEGRSWEDRSHFLAVAARAMRQILMDHAKARSRIKRGGDYRRVAFEELREALRAPAGLTLERLEALAALDDSLKRLEAANPRQARIVECRFFGGMTIRDTATALGVSPATVKRGWSVAQAWLYRDLKRSPLFADRGPPAASRPGGESDEGT